jgi:hypothetical protein
MVMVLANQVQRSMDDEMRKMVPRPPPLCGRFRPDNAQRQDYLSGRLLIRQHIRGLILPAMAPVQPTHDAVRRQDDRSCHTRGASRPPRDHSGIPYQSVPSRIRHDDIDGRTIEAGRPGTRRFH